MSASSLKQLVIANVTYQFAVEIYKVSTHHRFYGNIAGFRETIANIFIKFIYLDRLPIKFELVGQTE